MNKIIIEEDIILKNLRHFFNYRSLRPGQLDMITRILGNEDMLICKETNFGKSLCYQLAGLMRYGIVIVITQYYSRAENKSKHLSTQKNIKCAVLGNKTSNGYSDKNGLDLRNVLVNKNKILDDLQNLKSSQLKFLYVTLDYFINSNKLQQVVRSIYEQDLLQAIVIDEVRCVSEWSYSLQRDYSNIGILRDLYRNVPFICFTGLMSKENLAITQNLLHLRNPCVLNDASMVDNLSYKVMYTDETFNYTKLVSYVKINYQNKTGLIYCRNIKDCLEISKQLEKCNIRNICYFQLTNDEKWLKWINTYGIVIICITGVDVDIDLQKLDFIIHVNVPRSLDAYVQEIRIAGKNETECDCIVLYNLAECNQFVCSVIEAYKDKTRWAGPECKKRMIVYLKEDLQKFFDFILYAENTSECRQCAIFTHYNEENVVIPCGKCDICAIMADSFVIDMTFSLKKILMAVWSINRYQNSTFKNSFYASIQNILDFLLGVVNERVNDTGLTNNCFFASFGSWNRTVLHRLIFILLRKKFLVLNHFLNIQCELALNLIITTEGQRFIKSNTEFNVKFSFKDIHYYKWFNIDCVRKQFMNDLKSTVSYHKKDCSTELFKSFTEDLFKGVPRKWIDYKYIKSKYLEDKISKLDEDLFGVCLIYYKILKSL